MSSMSNAVTMDLADGLLREQYKEDIGKIILGEKNELVVSYRDLESFGDESWAANFVSDYEKAVGELREAAKNVDLAVEPSEQAEALDRVIVGISDFPRRARNTPLDVMRESPEGIVSVEGDLAKCTTPNDKIIEAVYRCQMCNETKRLENPSEVPRFYRCKMCDKKNPPKTLEFQPNESAFESFCKLRVETPPSERGELQKEHVDVEVAGDLVWYGSEVGLAGRTGEPVSVIGEVKHVQSDSDELLFSKEVDSEFVGFRSDNVTLNPREYLSTIKEYAEQENVIDTFKQSLVPELYETPAWDTALELLVTYLFGAPRVDIQNGPTIRGDIHLLIISDYGMGKSMVNEAIAEFSPSCIKESVTGLSSDVGLLAAAVEDDFGNGGWTLEPGILVRGNGGHVILDEIDKTDADLERMNDALEGEQVVDVNKAGQTASFDSRCGLLATGNPEGDRFDPQTSTREQISIAKSLLSRFDGIVTMRDTPDETVDRNIAETAGTAYLEGLEFERGDIDELDALQREVSVEVGRNWVYYARENFDPKPTREQVMRVSEWYAEEARTLNDDKQNAPVPVNSRHVHAVLRRAMAYSRLRLSDVVVDRDVERALELQKQLIGENWDGEAFVPAQFQVTNQRDRVSMIKDLIRSESNKDAVVSEAVSAGVSEDKVIHIIQKLRDKREVYEPETGVLRLV